MSSFFTDSAWLLHAVSLPPDTAHSDLPLTRAQQAEQECNAVEVAIIPEQLY